jgi:hypothetical protein
MELTGIAAGFVLQPRLGHHYDNKRTEGEDELHDLSSLTCDIHAAEGLSRTDGGEHDGLAEQQGCGELAQHANLALALRQAEVSKEHDNQCENQQGLGNHI